VEVTAPTSPGGGIGGLAKSGPYSREDESERLFYSLHELRENESLLMNEVVIGRLALSLSYCFLIVLAPRTREINRAAFDLPKFQALAAAQDGALKQSGEVLTGHVGGSDRAKARMLVLKSFDRSAHPSAHWLLHAAINLPQEIEGSFVRGEFD
jgi:hypothetical protein